jgi:NitT/TauT family transport system substrate-binding protein
MLLFRLRRLPAVLFALGFIATIGASAIRVEAADVVNVTGTVSDLSANAFYAADMGFFKNAGLDVHFTIVTNGPASMAAVSSGATDVGITNVPTLAIARERGLSLRFIAPAAIISLSTDTDSLAVPLDSAIRTGADLNGKIIGVPGVKTVQQLHVMAWMDQHGGEYKTVKFVEIPFPQMGQALSAHRIDAGLLSEPFWTPNKTTTRSLGNPTQSVAPPYMLLGWAATDAWISAHPDLAAKFALAIRQASEWANSHHKESGVILAKYAQMDPAVTAAMARSTYGTELSPSLIAPLADASYKYGMIEKKVVPADMMWRPSLAGK